MASNFGLSAAGFVAKQQQDIISEIRASLQAALGQNINLLPEAVLGQIVDIFSEREALLWQLNEAVYASQYPAGAEGTSVDNILSLNGLKRLAATATKTSPAANGVQGLLLFGTATTLIPAGSLISVNGQPSQQFSLDSDVTIAAAINAIQTIAFTSVPTLGHFKIQIVDPNGNTLTTTFINWNDNAATIVGAINALQAPDMSFPYADVTVTGNFTTGYVINFGGTSGAQSQNLLTFPVNTLFDGSVATNIQAINTRAGSVPQGIGAATCTQTGPIPVAANNLTVIDTPVSGWTSVTNPLDCDTGTDIEDDTDALTRRGKLLSAQANGPLQAIVADMLLLTDVKTAVGFENTSIDEDGSIQEILFSAPPVSGNFKLQLGGSTGPITGTINFNDSTPTIQTKIQALGAPYDIATVSGTFADGFFVFFGTGTQANPRMILNTNSLNDGTNAVVVSLSGRPPKSFEIVVQDGTDATIAAAIYKAKPAGIQSYGNKGPFNQTDSFGNIFPIYFSRPSLVPIYVAINLEVDQSVFPPDGINTIQEDIVAIGADLLIGEKVILFGSNGLVGGFNSVPGIVDYDLFAGTAPAPSGQNNITIQPQQLAQFETFNIVVNVTYV